MSMRKKFSVLGSGMTGAQSILLLGGVGSREFSRVKKVLLKECLVPKFVRSANELKKSIDGSELGVICFIDNLVVEQATGVVESIKDSINEFDMPIIGLATEKRTNQSMVSFYKAGFHMIINWSDEELRLASLVKGLCKSGFSETRSKDKDMAMCRAVGNRMSSEGLTQNSNLQVSCFNRIITVSGRTDSLKTKLEIENVITHTPGVKGVTMESLRVVPGNPKEDKDLSRVVKKVIGKVCPSAKYTLDVDVRNGKVYLNGTLPNERIGEMLKRSIVKVDGLIGYKENFDFHPGLHEKDFQTSLRLKKRLERFYPNINNLRIAVYHGQVVIRGVVKSLFKAVQLENAALNLMGVRRVVNKLKVSQVPRGT